jgi:hypothetical protein
MDESEATVARAGRPSEKASSGDIAALVILANVVMVGLGGLYSTTQSIVVTAIAALLVALLAIVLVENAAIRLDLGDRDVQ